MLTFCRQRNIFEELDEEEVPTIKQIVAQEDRILPTEAIGRFVEDEEQALKEMLTKFMKSRRSFGIHKIYCVSFGVVIVCCCSCCSYCGCCSCCSVLGLVVKFFEVL